MLVWGFEPRSTPIVLTVPSDADQQVIARPFDLPGTAQETPNGVCRTGTPVIKAQLFLSGFAPLGANHLLLHRIAPPGLFHSACAVGEPGPLLLEGRRRKTEMLLST